MYDTGAPLSLTLSLFSPLPLSLTHTHTFSANHVVMYDSGVPLSPCLYTESNAERRRKKGRERCERWGGGGKKLLETHNMANIVQLHPREFQSLTCGETHTWVKLQSRRKDFRPLLLLVSRPVPKRHPPLSSVVLGSPICSARALCCWLYLAPKLADFYCKFSTPTLFVARSLSISLLSLSLSLFLSLQEPPLAGCPCKEIQCNCTIPNYPSCPAE